jgi:hypothetical protein
VVSQVWAPMFWECPPPMMSWFSFAFLLQLGTENLLVHHKPDHHVLLCVSWFHVTRRKWFGWQKKNTKTLQHPPPIKWRIRQSPGFLLVWCTSLLEGDGHTDNFPLPNSNHTKASLWLIYIQLHYVSSHHIWLLSPIMLSKLTFK